MVYIFKIGWLKTIVPPLVPPYKNQTEVLNENHKLKHPVQVWEGPPFKSSTYRLPFFECCLLFRPEVQNQYSTHSGVLTWQL